MKKSRFCHVLNYFNKIHDFQISKKLQEILRLLKISNKNLKTSMLQLQDNIVLLGPLILWNVCVVPVFVERTKNMCSLLFVGIKKIMKNVINYLFRYSLQFAVVKTILMFATNKIKYNSYYVNHSFN